jgi:hypothetical protein
MNTKAKELLFELDLRVYKRGHNMDRIRLLKHCCPKIIAL